MIRGLRATQDKKANPDGEDERIRAMVGSNAMLTVTTCKKLSGGHLKLKCDERKLKPVYRDEYTDELIPPELSRAAIVDELDYFN